MTLNHSCSPHLPAPQFPPLSKSESVLVRVHGEREDKDTVARKMFLCFLLSGLAGRRLNIHPARLSLSFAGAPATDGSGNPEAAERRREAEKSHFPSFRRQYDSHIRHIASHGVTNSPDCSRRRALPHPHSWWETEEHHREVVDCRHLNRLHSQRLTTQRCCRLRIYFARQICKHAAKLTPDLWCEKL